MFFGKNLYDLIDHLVRGIAVRLGVVDHREIGFGKSQHDSVQIRNFVKNIADLVAEEIQKTFSQQVEFSALVHHFRAIFQQTFGQHDFAVPVVKLFADAVGKGGYFAHFFDLSLYTLFVAQFVSFGIGFIKGKAIHAAEMMGKGAADFKTVEIIFLRLFDDSLHIFNIHMGGMHQRPGDLIFFHIFLLLL